MGNIALEFGRGSCLIKQTPEGTQSVSFGMCSHGALPCDITQDSCHNKEPGNKYWSRLKEVNEGAWIDPTNDLAVLDMMPQTFTVDPETSDLYVKDIRGSFWPRRDVIWKYDAQKKKAKTVAGHFHQDYKRSIYETSGFGGRATAAFL